MPELTLPAIQSSEYTQNIRTGGIMKKVTRIATLAVILGILIPTSASAGSYCNNGTYSSNSGRGTCSYNGGIDRSYPSFSDPGSSSYNRNNGLSSGLGSSRSYGSGLGGSSSYGSGLDSYGSSLGNSRSYGSGLNSYGSSLGNSRSYGSGLGSYGTKQCYTLRCY